MNYADAAEQVLRRHSPSAPLHYRRITELAVADRLVAPGGNTPEASMNAALSMELQNRAKREVAQRFERHGKGLYSLALT